MDFGAMFNTWIKVLTNPTEETFQGELDSPRASMGTALTWMFLGGVVATIFSFLTNLINLTNTGNIEQILRENPDIPPEMAEMLTRMAGPAMLGGISLLGIFLIPFFFLVGVGILYMIAMLLGGQGDFGRYAYLLATFRAPLSIASTLLNFVPLLGACIGLGLLFYQIYLEYLATKVALNLTSGRALIVVLTPVLLFFGLIICGLIFIIFVAASANGSTAP